VLFRSIGNLIDHYIHITMMFTAALLRREMLHRSSRCTFVARSFSKGPIRRRKPDASSALLYSPLLDNGAWPTDETGGSSWKLEPFNPSEDYVKKVSMSPWVPCPDPVVRKMLELANAGEDDVHVDLGCGDGRVNFQAIDAPFGVKRSIGIDVDPDILQKAKDRLARRFPVPDIDFFIADLKDFKHRAWDHVKSATIITMYFVEKALEDIRPTLERVLEGKQAIIVTCGYPITQWDPSHVEYLLGLPVHVYKWGYPNEPEYKPFKGMSDEEVERIMTEHRKSVEVNRKLLFEENDDTLQPVRNENEVIKLEPEVPWKNYEEFYEDYSRDDFDSEERRADFIRNTGLPPEQYAPKKDEE